MRESDFDAIATENKRTPVPEPESLVRCSSAEGEHPGQPLGLVGYVSLAINCGTLTAGGGRVSFGGGRCSAAGRWKSALATLTSGSARRAASLRSIPEYPRQRGKIPRACRAALSCSTFRDRRWRKAFRKTKRRKKRRRPLVDISEPLFVVRTPHGRFELWADGRVTEIDSENVSRNAPAEEPEATEGRENAAVLLERRR